jgi:hypothetical protein
MVGKLIRIPEVMTKLIRAIVSVVEVIVISSNLDLRILLRLRIRGKPH